MKKILVIVAHPDDEILGCAGTVARLIREGHEAHTLILGEGITSRDIKRNMHRNADLERLHSEALDANKVLGVKKIYFHNFPDNKFDSVPLLDIVKKIEKLKEEIKPEIVFTHSETDLNIDHSITFRAVLTATRPLVNETVKELYSFEVLSSTGWAYPLSFSPDTFFDITKTLQYKLKAMGKYKSELMAFPHPRSLRGIELNAKYWGMQLGVKYAEALKSIRVIK